ncbi:MAG: 30S ribosomal protein S3, partial [Halodesulfurarchaeum sp.]
VEKFNRGYIKHNGEPAEEIVDAGQAVAVMKLGTIGVNVKIIPPNAELPDDFRIDEEADVSDLVVEEAGESVEELLEGEPEDPEAGAEDFEEVETPGDESPAEAAAVEEELLEDVEEADEEAADGDEATDESGEAPEIEDVDADAEEEAEALLDEMDEEVDEE